MVAYFFAAILGSFFVVIFYLKNKIDFNLWVNDPDYSQHASQIIAQEFNSNVILGMAIYMFGVGGWLLVRYLLERKPDVIDDSFL